MKTNIFKITFLGCITSIAILSCNSSPEQKVEDANANTEKAAQDLLQARADSVDAANEFAKYNESIEKEIQENDVKIAKLKEDLKKEKKELREKYEKDLTALDEKNETLKEKMHEYKAEGKEKWEAFKQAINEEMDDLGKAISKAAERNQEK